MADSTNPFVTMDEINSISSETNQEMIDMSLDDTLNPFDEFYIPDVFTSNRETPRNPDASFDNAHMTPGVIPMPHVQSDISFGNAHMTPGVIPMPHVQNQDSFGNPSRTLGVIPMPGDNSTPLNPQILMVKREADALEFTDEKLRYDFIIHRLQMLSHSSDRNSTVNIQSPKIKMNTWKPEVESWEVFIHKFERYASDLHWDESAKLLHLISCLEGKALAIYRRIEMDKVANYHELRRELEKAFSLTAEQLGNAFNNASKRPDETATQFAANLKEKFVNWYRKANNCHNMSTEGLLNHVIKEQFVKSLPTQCKQEIKQHKLINMNEVAKYAENYFEAHQVERKLEVKKPQGKAVANNLANTNNPSTGNLNKNFHCRNCKTNNHWYFDCPNRKNMVAAAAQCDKDLASWAKTRQQVIESSGNNVEKRSKPKSKR